MTYEEQIKVEFALNEKISNVVLIFLLLVRLVDEDLAIWIFGAHVPEWVIFWYNGISYILTATIVWLNRHRLAALNIDRPFMSALILGGAFFSSLQTPYNIGALVGITAGLVYWGYINYRFVFKNPVPYPRGTGLLILLLILLALAPVFLFPSTLKTLLSFQIFINTIIGTLQAYLILNVFEEVLFRGALWAYLRSHGLSERAVFAVQACLFWIAYHRFLFLGKPYVFWVAVPGTAILLGLLAWRSKSLTPSILGHFLFNFISGILLRIY